MAIQYHILDRSRHEIRLLELLPQAHSQLDKLIPTCRIFHAYLPEKPQFVALSYVWGNLKNRRVIVVENSPVFVTDNLYDAMMALRPVDNCLVIWIDFLCIDQASDQEKSWQVELMKDIYRGATQVFAWLGRADSDSDLVMDYLNTLGENAEACGIFGEGGQHHEIWRRLVSQEPSVHHRNQSHVVIETANGNLGIIPRRKLDSLFYSMSGWHQQDNLLPISGMQRLFTRPWWGRIWVLQEITHPENAEFICGSKRISRRRCSAAMNAYKSLWLVLTENWITKARPNSEYHREVITRVFHHRPMVMLSSWRIYRYNRFPLLALLRATCVGSINPRQHGHHLESSDPRDKIFALLSLASDREDLRQRDVFPDYSKSCAEVYTLATVALLQQGHMSLLSFCKTHKLQANLPSWVPDWSRSATHMLQEVEGDYMTLYPTFSASGAKGQPPNVTIIRNDGSITGISVACSVYDEIDAAGSFPGRGSSHEVPLSETYSWPKKWLIETLRLTYEDQRRSLEFSDRLRAATRTSIGGVGFNQDANLARVGDDRFLDAVVLVKNGLRYIAERNFKSDVEQFLANPAIKENVKGRTVADTRISLEMLGKSRGRLPFVTRKGHLVLSSEHVKRGDVVALIRGTQVPFILRRQIGGAFRLVSEAYVDGIMDGEAAENSKFGVIELV